MPPRGQVARRCLDGVPHALAIVRVHCGEGFAAVFHQFLRSHAKHLVCVLRRIGEMGRPVSPQPELEQHHRRAAGELLDEVQLFLQRLG